MDEGTRLRLERIAEAVATRHRGPLLGRDDARQIAWVGILGALRRDRGRGASRWSWCWIAAEGAVRTHVRSLLREHARRPATARGRRPYSRTDLHVRLVVAEAMEAITPRQREVVVRSCWRDETPSEIARADGRHVTSVEESKRTALDRLRDRLAPRSDLT